MDMKIAKNWYAGGPEMDALLTTKFKDTLLDAENKKSWLLDHNGRLSYILMCDQYSRNIFRGTADAFKYDPLALAASKDIV